MTAPLPHPLVEGAEPPGYTYERIDLADEASVASLVRRIRPDLVVHAAAALRDEDWPVLVRSNLDAVAFLTKALVSLATPTRLVVVSSGSVYGEPYRLPLREDDPCRPLDLYGATKRAAEDVGRIIALGTQVTVLVARVFNLVGPGLHDRHLPASLARQLAAMRLGFCDLTLRMAPLDSTRDFIDVSDAAAAVLRVGWQGLPGTTVNIASGRETPVADILDLLVSHSALGDSLRVDWQPRRVADVPRAVADVSRLVDLGFEPAKSLADSLGDMFDYYVDQVAHVGCDPS